MHCGRILARICAKNNSMDSYRYGWCYGRLLRSIVHWQQRDERTPVAYIIRVYCSRVKTAINIVRTNECLSSPAKRFKFIRTSSFFTMICITYNFGYFNYNYILSMAFESIHILHTLQTSFSRMIRIINDV